MNRRVVAVTAVAFTAAAVVAGLTIPASAGVPAPTATAPAVAPDAFTAMQRDFRLDAAGVAVRLDREATASRTQLALRKTLGARFGGAWLSADASTLTVAVTDQEQASRVRAAGAIPRLVARSEAQLDEAVARLDANAAAAPRAVPGWYVDVVTNSVVVLARSGGTAAATAFAKASGLDPAAVRVELSTEDPRPLIDVIGGNAYFIGAGTRCSVGFSVNGGFVTAGHCGTTGSTTSQPSGTFRGSSFPGNDYAWVQVAAGNTPRGLVNGYPGTVTVSGSQDAAIGASVCRSGSTTGWHCGTIQQRNASVTYPQGTVTGLVRTNVCAEPGDSGGSWLSGNQAQGVTSGGSGNCTSGGTTYFQPVNEILQTYGLVLVTGGGTPPTTPPPGGSCTGREFTVNGSITSGAQQIQPNGSYYQSVVSGTHSACLDGPTGTDLDLYLQKWTGASWATVATSDSPNPDEQISYAGTAGYYRYVVHAYSGSGAYVLGYSNP